MATQVRVGEFVADTGGGSQTFSISGWSETVEAVLFFICNATANGAEADHRGFGIGFSDGTNERGVSGWDDDAVTTTAASRRQAAGHSIYLRSSPNDAEAEAHVTSFGAGQVTVSWDTTPTSAFKIIAVMFSDLADVAIGTNSPGDHVDTLGWSAAPDLVLCLAIASGGGDDSGGGDCRWILGACVNDGSETQRATALESANNQSTSACQGLIQNDEVTSRGQTPDNNNSTISSFDADGWNFDQSYGTNIYWLALRLNGISAAIKSADSPTATGDYSISSLAWEPQAVLMATSMLTAEESHSTSGTAGQSGIGVFDTDGNEASQTTRSEDGVTTTDTGSYHDGKAIAVLDHQGTKVQEETFVSMNSDGFTLNAATADGTARKRWFIAFETDSAGGGIVATGIASLEALGGPSLELGVAPSGIGSAEAIGAAAVGLGLAPAGITSAEAIGAALLSLDLTPAGIGSAEAIGSHSLTADAQIDPAGIASLEALGSPSLELDLAATGIPSGEALGDPTMTTAAAIGGAGAIASLEAHGATLVKLDVSPAGIATLEAHGTQVFDLGLAPEAIGSAEALGAAALALGVTPAGLVSLEAIGDPVVSGGLVITPAGVGSAEVLGDPTVTAAAAITATAIGGAEALGSHTLTEGATIAPTAVGSLEALGDPTVSAAAIVTEAGGIASAEEHGAALFAVELRPAGVGSAEAHGAATLGIGLDPSGIATGGAAGLPALGLSLIPGGIGSLEAFGPHEVFLVGLFPAGITSQEAFGSPKLAGIAFPVTMSLVLSPQRTLEVVTSGPWKMVLV